MGTRTERAGHSPCDLRWTDWGWRYASRRAWAVRHLNLTIDKAERVLLLGASGSGKSTVLHSAAGLLGSADEGEQEGAFLVNGEPPLANSGRMALVMQDPESQIILSRVGDDAAFGPENMRMPPEQIWERVGESLTLVGLDLPLGHSTHELSGGQKQRLVLAGALAMGAQWLLLDEPTANLDPAGVTEVRDAVAKIVDDRSTGLIVIEHHCDVWAPLVDRVVVLSPEGVIADGTPSEVFTTMGDHLADMGVWVPGSVTVAPPVQSRTPDVNGSPQPTLGAQTAPRFRPQASGAKPVLEARQLSIGYSGKAVLTNLTITIPRGLSTVITGPNGSGKTTLALTLAGLLPRLEGTLTAASDLSARGVLDPEKWKSKELLTRIGTVFQNPEHQFVSSTVAEELTVGPRALKRSKSSVTTAVEELLDLLHLSHLAKANPFTLSGGEKRRLSVGTVLATNPQVIILDEPTFGQDRNTWKDLVGLISHLRDGGTTIISITHDRAYVDALGDSVIEMEAL